MMKNKGKIVTFLVISLSFLWGILCLGSNVVAFDGAISENDNLFFEDDNILSEEDDVLFEDGNLDETTDQLTNADVNLLTVTQEGKDFVYIQWENLNASADGYTLYRSAENMPFEIVKSVSTESTYNYGLVNGMTYTYKVRPYYLDTNGAKKYGNFSNEISVYIGVLTPKNIIIKVMSKNSIALSWDGDINAEGYILYRSEDGNNWTLVKRIVNNTSTITYGLKENVTYYFRLKAYRTVAGIERISDNSEAISYMIGVGKPENLSVTPKTKNSVEISWDSVPNATAYRIYRSDGDGDYTLVKTVTETTTRNYNLFSNMLYHYKIAAIGELDGVSLKSAYSDSVGVKLGLDTPSVTACYNGATSAVITWEPIENATAYRLYRKKTDEQWTLIKTVKDTSTITYGLTSGECYEYTVKAINDSGEYIAESELSESESYFHVKAPTLSYRQEKVNKITLSWTAAVGADTYKVYLAYDGHAELLNTTALTEMEISVSEETAQYYVIALKNEIESKASEILNVTPIIEGTLTFSIANAIDSSQISLAWEPIQSATGYEVARCSVGESEYETIGTVSDATCLDSDLVEETEYSYRYRAVYDIENGTFCGNWSESVTVKTLKTPQYRALLIGEENYIEILNGPMNDIEAMKNTLSGMTTMGWNVYSQSDATKEEIISLIKLAYADAAETDVSLFYYSGHGITDSSEYYSGALMTVDYEYLPLSDLAELLSAIPGKVVVILDSCGSGAAISDGTATVQSEADLFEPQEFNNNVIAVFSAKDTIQDRSGDFKGSKYYVLTSSAYEQNSRSVNISNIWGGAFTRGVVGSVGYDFNSKLWDSSMPGDIDDNRILTLNECYIYCSKYAEKYQDVQVYPDNSEYKLFYRE